MPEDYQAIFDGLGIDTTQAPNNQGTDVNNNQADNAGTTTDNSANATDNQNQNDNAQEQQAQAQSQAQAQAQAQPDTVDPAEQRRNDAFAAMRSENSSYKKLVQHLMRGAGYTGAEKDFIKQLEDAAYKQEAARQGNQVSPEVLRRMDELETQNRSILESRNRELFIANLKSLQDTFKLSEKDIKEFIDLAASEKIDLTVPGTNFRTLYQGLFFDKLKDKMVEEARQEWIKQDNKTDNATNPDGKSGKKDPVPTNVNTMAEFDSLLRSIPKNNKN